jgi:hypothetical protein
MMITTHFNTNDKLEPSSLHFSGGRCSGDVACQRKRAASHAEFVSLALNIGM